MHGSLGWRGHHHEHAVNFLNNGFAIFRVSSFDARQVVSIVKGSNASDFGYFLADCFNALKILSKHPDIDATKIFITGWSLGGSTAVYSAWEPLAKKPCSWRGKFCRTYRLLSGCFMWPEEMRWSKSPILTLIGADDDYTPSF
ncbi:MAG: hypothetical protein Ct9H300mP3_07710 [Gammaproteobacteria bacterium]|nr:MAG: hypothetical protein Ct9H300mP3_07710 [Gammaproteobacteria bacterium]